MATRRPGAARFLRSLRSAVPELPLAGSLKCYYKPFRTFPRTFKARDVGRIACKAVAQGVPPADIRQELAECVPCAEDQQSKRLLQQALAAMQASNVQLELLVVAIGAVVAALASVQLVGRFVPQARLALLVLRPAVTRIEGFLGSIIARKAANDAVIAVLRRAA